MNLSSIGMCDGANQVVEHSYGLNAKCYGSYDYGNQYVHFAIVVGIEQHKYREQADCQSIRQNVFHDLHAEASGNLLTFYPRCWCRTGW